MPALTRPLLVGELNPYGGDPSVALYPLPPHASGGRLQRILGLSTTQYLRLFDRANLCVGAWDLAEARASAGQILADPTRTHLVLLGAKVSRVFCGVFEPFTLRATPGRPGQLVATLPHPSGLSRAWNEPGAELRARELLARLGVVADCTHCREHPGGPRGCPCTHASCCHVGAPER